MTHEPWNRAKRRITADGFDERWCRRCEAWWPDDAEFWYYHGTGNQRCRACSNEHAAAAWRRKRHPELGRVILGPAICQVCRQFVYLVPNPDLRKKLPVWEHREGSCAVAA